MKNKNLNKTENSVSKHGNIICCFHEYMKQHNTFGTGHNYINNYQILFTLSLGLILPIMLIIDLLK